MSDLRQRKLPKEATPPRSTGSTEAEDLKRGEREAVLAKRLEEEAYEFNHPLLVFAFALGFALLSYVGSQYEARSAHPSPSPLVWAFPGLD